MKTNLDELPSNSPLDNDDYNASINFLETIKYLLDEEQYNSYYSNYFNNNNIIELDEEKYNNEDNDEITEEDIYFIKKPTKEKSKGGRLPKNKIPEYDIKHNKFGKDNIIQKIIRYFIFVLLNVINNTYQGGKTQKKSEPLLRSIDAKEYNVFSNQKIFEFFNKTLRDVFSADISPRNSNFLSTHSKDHNKIVIESLIKENKEKNVIELLNLTVRETYEKYINNEIEGYNFENDLIQIEKKEGKEYKDRYEEIALELIDIINKKGEKIK